MNPQDSLPWRVRDGHVHLLASRRAATGGQPARLRFPPLPATSPLAAGSELVELGPTGRLYSFTIVHAAPKLGKPPVPLGLVDFDEGLRIFGRMHYAQGRRPVIGETLRVVIDDSEQGPIYAFEPEPR
ncbi:MAG TPA: OB-fold domain-containing protein [Rubrivivax sp.]|nr:OB-fold domain-containing protein [Rubrivivax sp.]